MKINKYTLTLLTLSSMMVLGACSQTPTHSEQKTQAVTEFVNETSPVDRAAVLTELMTEKLELTQAQRDRVEPINLGYARRVSILAVSANPGIDKTAEYERLMTEKEATLKTVFNQRQMERFKALKAQLRDAYRTL